METEIKECNRCYSLLFKSNTIYNIHDKSYYCSSCHYNILLSLRDLRCKFNKNEIQVIITNCLSTENNIYNNDDVYQKLYKYYESIDNNDKCKKKFMRDYQTFYVNQLAHYKNYNNKKQQIIKYTDMLLMKWRDIKVYDYFEYVRYLHEKIHGRFIYHDFTKYCVIVIALELFKYIVDNHDSFSMCKKILDKNKIDSKHDYYELLQRDIVDNKLTPENVVVKIKEYKRVDKINNYIDFKYIYNVYRAQLDINYAKYIKGEVKFDVFKKSVEIMINDQFYERICVRCNNSVNINDVSLDKYNYNVICNICVDGDDFVDDY